MIPKEFFWQHSQEKSDQFSTHILNGFVENVRDFFTRLSLFSWGYFSRPNKISEKVINISSFFRIPSFGPKLYSEVPVRKQHKRYAYIWWQCIFCYTFEWNVKAVEAEFSFIHFSIFPLFTVCFLIIVFSCHFQFVVDFWDAPVPGLWKKIPNFNTLIT